MLLDVGLTLANKKRYNQQKIYQINIFKGYKVLSLCYRYITKGNDLTADRKKTMLLDLDLILTVIKNVLGSFQIP